jgi:hypothetical protein
MSKFLGALILCIAGATAAQADGWWVKHQHTPVIMPAPEVDPTSALTGLTLFAGALAVLRGRRNKK